MKVNASVFDSLVAAKDHLAALKQTQQSSAVVTTKHELGLNLTAAWMIGCAYSNPNVPLPRCSCYLSDEIKHRVYNSIELMVLLVNSINAKIQVMGEWM